MTSQITKSFFSPSLIGCEKNQSGSEDVSSGVGALESFISTKSMLKHRLNDTVLFNALPSGFAAIRGVPKVYFNHSPHSFFRFSLEDADEGRPASVVDASAIPGLCRPSVTMAAAGCVRISKSFSSPSHVFLIFKPSTAIKS